MSTKELLRLLTDLDDTLADAQQLRDLMAGASALLREADESALDEVVDVARARSEALVTALERQIAAVKCAHADSAPRAKRRATPG